MKRTIITAVIFLIIGGAIGYFLNPLVNRKSAPAGMPARMDKPGRPVSGSAASDTKEGEDERLDLELRQKGAIGRIDYPLIDIYFEKDKTYKVTVQRYANDLSDRGDTKPEAYREYEDKGGFFQQNKGDFSIMTIPSGLGTTPSYILKVYEGEKCIRTIDCMEIREGILDDKWKSKNENKE